MCQRLQGKIAVVTGAGQGIGRGISLRLAQEGCDVAVVDINPDTASSVAREIEAMGRRAVAIVADVSKESDVIAMAREVEAKLGKADILINNAGILRSAFITDVPEEDWDAVISVNLKGAFLCTKHIAPHMIEKRWGRIIFMSSKSGKKGGLWLAAYCSSKFGLIGLAQSVAMDLAPYNITSNAVCPGDVFETPLWNELDKQYAKKLGIPPEKVRERYRDRVPLGRETKIADVANVVVFLCSEEAEFITGQAINVSGGQIVW